MEEPWAISLLSLAMLIGCYIAGSIPLAFSFSESKMRFITVLGAGLLVGTALAVIIPEGIHALFEGISDGHIHRAVNPPLPADDPQILPADVAKDGDHHNDDHSVSRSSEEELHYLIGVALVSGFVFMLLVDQIGGGGGHSHGPPAKQASDVEGGSRVSRGSITATLGLVVHAAADGIAMGAAAVVSRPDVQMIVFMAIMLHKAPAAFGLVSFLLHENYQRNRIRKHLLFFAMAAPVAALITYFGLSHAGKQALTSVNATGISMLFSAGTFLYVATVHVLPEISKERPTDSVDNEGSVEMIHGFSRTDLFAVVSGCVAPLLLSFGHHH